MENTLTKTGIEIPSFEEFLNISRKRYPRKSKQEIIKILKKSISDCEQKYQMNTKNFVARFEKGEFENSDEYPGHELFRWWSDYHSYLKLTSKRKD